MPDVFYRNALPFEDFSEIARDRHYVQVPDSWWVLITDVKGSTKAIESGRYKDVNTIGAASIIAVNNAFPDYDLPYVFGGDGATILIPDELAESIKPVMASLKKLSQTKFNLELRTGLVQVQEISNQGQVIKVAKHRLYGSKAIAMIKGGGIALAEKLIKGKEGYEIHASATDEVDLTNLTCRWSPIPSRHGKVLTLLVQARKDPQESVYTEFIDFLKSLFNGDLNQSNPINLEGVRYNSIWENLKNEVRFFKSWLNKNFFLRAFIMFWSSPIFNHPWIIKKLGWSEYYDGIPAHSDYKKFDDMLRMIVDVDTNQFNAIEEYLKSAYQKKELFFGIHTSKDSLMTCYTDRLKDGNHIHFVDGGNGGYAIAAKQLKGQIKEPRAEI